MNETVEVPGQAVPQTEQDFSADSASFISGNLDTQGLSIDYEYDSLSIDTNINGSVGDTVVMTAVGRVAIQGEVNGTPINQSGEFDLRYEYERIQ
jgi:hypothetical protein